MKVLVIAAHPDDDAIGCGGAIYQHTQAGDEVSVIYLTNGGKGIPGTPEAEACFIRSLEALHAAEVLGILASNLSFPAFEDGRLGGDPSSVIATLRGIINLAAPDLIYVPHDREGHPDHRAAAQLLRAALPDLAVAPPRVLMYEIWTPLGRVDHLVHLSQEEIDRKLMAIDAHLSQSPNRFSDGAEGLAMYRGTFQGHTLYAEAFQRMRNREGDILRITVVLFTYSPDAHGPRSDYAMRTLQAAIKNLDPGRHELRWHIADDGSDPRHMDALLGVLRDHGIDPTVTDAQRGGYGRSYNLATQAIHNSTDMVLALEDDWELTRPLKLGDLADALEAAGDTDQPDTMGCIRLGYLGFTQTLRGSLVVWARQTFLHLDPTSPEPHVFTGHPRLETVAWERGLGAWPEGLAAGATEWAVAQSFAGRLGVAWPLDAGIPANPEYGSAFAHIGSEGVGQVMPR